MKLSSLESAPTKTYRPRTDAAPRRTEAPWERLFWIAV
jgi:hypothetical protein